MSTRWWPSVALCAFLLAVIAVVAQFDSATTEIPAARSMVVTTTVQQTATAVAPIAVETTAASYVGNTNSHRFHRNSCTYADCRNCTAKFTTREEAIAAGYRPCGTCNP